MSPDTLGKEIMKQRNVIITGCSSGIGRFVAEGLKVRSVLNTSPVIINSMTKTEICLASNINTNLLAGVDSHWTITGYLITNILKISALPLRSPAHAFCGNVVIFHMVEAGGMPAQD